MSRKNKNIEKAGAVGANARNSREKNVKNIHESAQIVCIRRA